MIRPRPPDLVGLPARPVVEQVDEGLWGEVGARGWEAGMDTGEGHNSHMEGQIGENVRVPVINSMKVCIICFECHT